MSPFSAPQPGAGDDLEAFDRGPWMLAAAGAWVASLYWAAMTVVLVLAATFGSLSGMQVILPVVLIVLYAVRGFQLWQGSQKAARSVLMLHGVGGVFALIQIFSGGGLITLVLQGAKVLVHLFGGYTAWRATKAQGRLID